MNKQAYVHKHEGHSHIISPSKRIKLIQSAVLKSDEEFKLSVCKHLTDPTKFKIYLILREVNEISVGDLENIINISQSAISHSLSDLKNVGIVKSQRCGQLICYSLNNELKLDLQKYFKIIYKREY